MASTESRVLHATQFIRRNFAQRVTLGDIATPLGISRFTLSRSFKAVMRVGFRQYLTQCRIEKARDLLERADCSITDIALMVGFGDLPRFDKVFKGHAGLSPSAYRKKLLAMPPAAGAQEPSCEVHVVASRRTRATTRPAGRRDDEAGPEGRRT